MTWVFAIPVMGFLAFIVVGSITGRVKLTSCCGIADARCDARMRDAFLDVPSANPTAGPATVDTSAEAAPGERADLIAVRRDGPVP